MESFPKNFENKETEPRLIKKWQEEKAFLAKVDPKKKPFCILLPPPNANGALHLGHALYVVEDILCRYKRKKGFSVLWLPGADHAGFETQYVFERQLSKKGKSRFDFDRVSLYDQIMDFVQDKRFYMYEQMKKLGFSLDWSREKFTLDPKIVDGVYDTFIKMHKDGLIYRNDYIVNYCVAYGSTFSDLEISHVQEKAKLYYIKYGPLTVATVRPETIFGDVAIAVNPKDKRYKNFVGKVIDAEIPGMTLHLKVISDDYVDMEFGTGALKITPAHDPNDYEIAKRHGLEAISVIGFDGKLNEKAGQYAGLKIKAAREKIIEDLQKIGLIEKIDEDYEHTVTYLYKDKKEVEPFIMPNWFVKVDKLAKPAQEVVKKGKVKFVPSRYEKIFKNWMENIRDWPISRQIVWGIRIPAWYDVSKNPEILVTFLNAKKERVTGKINELLTKEKYSIEEISNGLQSLIAPNDAEFVISKENPGKNFIQETDTLDTWFSSGQWPLLTLGYPDSEDFKYFYPTSVLDTASDIIFFWVARMIMFGLYLTGDVPFRHVYLHSLIVDREGKKMSKSRGNVVDPLIMVEKYGVDAFRFSLIAGTPAGRTVSFYEEKVKGYRNFINKIWNATRFVLMCLEKFEKDEVVKVYEGVGDVFDSKKADKWVKEMVSFEEWYDKNMEKFNLGLVAEKLYEKFWHEFCDVWIEEAKTIINDEKIVAEIKIEKMSILIGCLNKYLDLLEPFIPFVTAELKEKVKS